MSVEKPEQKPSDREICQSVINEWLAGAGAMITVQATVSVLENLQTRFGDRFTVQEACHTLDTLSKIALDVKESFLKRQNLPTDQSSSNP